MSGAVAGDGDDGASLGRGFLVFGGVRHPHVGVSQSPDDVGEAGQQIGRLRIEHAQEQLRPKKKSSHMSGEKKLVSSIEAGLRVEV